MRTIRRFLPNVPVRIRHVEPGISLSVRLRHHLGLIARGARAYEARYVAVLRACIERGDVVFDVGANVGFYATLFSRWVGPTGRVVAFEPDGQNSRLLRTNLKDCANATVWPVAVGATCGVSAFSCDLVTGQTGHAGDGPSWGHVQFGRGEEVRIEVPIATLDVEVDELGAAPDVVKIDAEGGEYEILAGSDRMLAEHRPLIVSEVSDWRHEQQQHARPARASLDRLHDFRYLVYDLDRGTRVGPADRPWMVVAVPEERTVERRAARALAAARVSP